MADFIEWEDLDLDYLLGDYTEDDRPLENGNSTDSEVEEVQIEKKLKKASTRTSSKTYQCPDCDKRYGSISGFRGHMTKKHEKSGLRATCYQVQPVSTAPLCSTNTFTEKFPSVVNGALDAMLKELQSIGDDSTYGSDLQLTTVSLLPYSSGLEGIVTPLYDMFMNVNSTLSDCIDDSTLMAKWHRFRQNSGVQDFLTKMGVSALRDISTKFEQMLLRFIFDELVSLRLSLVENTVKEVTEQVLGISETDKDLIITYIAGYVLHSCLKRKCLSQEECSLIRSNMVEESLGKENTWLEQVNRGGLTRPNKYSYGFFACVELEIRKYVDMSQLSAHSLQRDLLTEVVLESVSVKKAWSAIGFGERLKLCELFVGLFLTVRGNAVTKQYMRKRGQTAKTSLRKGLKAKNKGKSLRC